MPTINRYMTLIRRPMGMPKPEDFKIVESELPPLQEDEVLLKNLCFSLDPYMRGRMNDLVTYGEIYQLNERLFGHAISRVEESRNPNFKKGDIVLSNLAWQSHGIVKPEISEIFGRGAGTLIKLPEDIKPSLFLGILGMPGLTAYHGLVKIGEPKEGETVVVAAATGPVGSMVGQLAKARGCRVVGIAGGPDKCKFALETLGFDACVDHKTKTFPKDLAAACPEGIDVYFENVGGHVLKAVMPLLNVFARIPLCGLISWYNQFGTIRERTFSISQIIPRFLALAKLIFSLDLLPPFLGTLLGNRIKVQGFIALDFANEYPEFMQEAASLVRSGKIKYREHIVKGLENAPVAFTHLLEGKAFGKVIIDLE